MLGAGLGAAGLGAAGLGAAGLRDTRLGAAGLGAAGLGAAGLVLHWCCSRSILGLAVRGSGAVERGGASL